MELVVEGRVLHNGVLQRLAIGIQDGRVLEIRKVIKGERVLDFGDSIILPGAVDAHVHLREPGLTHKEDIASGTAAAVCGGVTTVLEMPNTLPPASSLSALREKAALASRKACADIGLYAGLTERGSPEELATLIAGYKLYMASATGELLVSDYSTLPAMLGRLEGKRKPVAVHAEDDGLIGSIGLSPGSLRSHSEARPPVAETGAVRRFIDALEAAGGLRGHICHISSSGTLELLESLSTGDTGGSKAGADLEENPEAPEGKGGAGVRGGGKGVEEEGVEKEGVEEAPGRPAQEAPGGTRRTGPSRELTPHHLLLDHETHEHLGSLAKTNPPVRGREERAALWRAFLEGRFDVLASDHAPHLEEEKETKFADAPAGVPGTETMVPLMMALAKRGRIPLELLVRAVCTRPAEIFGLDAGRIAPGAPAHLAVYDPLSISEVRGKRLHSKCAWSPFEGFEAVFPRAVLLRGELVVDGGEALVSPGAGRIVGGRPQTPSPPAAPEGPGRARRNHQ